jgi:hypothetical protein
MWAKYRIQGVLLNTEFQLCCGLGKHIIPSLQPIPNLIANWLKNNDEPSKEFKKHIRAYNILKVKKYFLKLGIQTFIMER